MALLIALEQDQALLTMVIQEASKVAEKHDYFVGRTALQKIMYFLKILDVPMNYSFDLHHYGPFCSDILRDTDTLIADDVIEDLSDPEDLNYDYTPHVAADELVSLFSEELEQYRDHISDVVNALVPLDPYRLELIATLNFLFRWVKATGSNGPFKKDVIQRFKQIKKDKFADDDVSLVYDALVEAGLISK